MSGRKKKCSEDPPGLLPGRLFTESVYHEQRGKYLQPLQTRRRF